MANSSIMQAFLPLDNSMKVIIQGNVQVELSFTFKSQMYTHQKWIPQVEKVLANVVQLEQLMISNSSFQSLITSVKPQLGLPSIISNTPFQIPDKVANMLEQRFDQDSASRVRISGTLSLVNNSPIPVIAQVFAKSTILKTNKKQYIIRDMQNTFIGHYKDQNINAVNLESPFDLASNIGILNTKGINALAV